MNISKAEQDKILREMRGLIDDFARDKKEFPSDQEFEERIGIKRTSILKYKKIIQEEDRKSLLEIFGPKRISNVKNTIKVLEENIEFYKKIRDKGSSNNEKMQAAKSMEESHLMLATVMHDAPEYLYIEESDDNATQEEHTNRAEEIKQ